MCICVSDYVYVSTYTSPTLKYYPLSEQRFDSLAGSVELDTFVDFREGITSEKAMKLLQLNRMRPLGDYSPHSYCAFAVIFKRDFVFSDFVYVRARKRRIISILIAP